MLILFWRNIFYSIETSIEKKLIMYLTKSSLHWGPSRRIVIRISEMSSQIYVDCFCWNFDILKTARFDIRTIGVSLLWNNGVIKPCILILYYSITLHKILTSQTSLSLFMTSFVQIMYWVIISLNLWAHFLAHCSLSMTHTLASWRHLLFLGTCSFWRRYTPYEN